MAAEIIELAVAIELECAALYEVFARNFQGRSDLVYFWKLYAEAERYHAASIRIHQATLPTEGTPEDPENNAANITSARSFLEEIRTNRTRYEREPVSIETAFGLARKVEENSAELHGRTQFFAGVPELQELFTKMAEEDRAHRDMLSTAAQKFASI